MPQGRGQIYPPGVALTDAEEALLSSSLPRGRLALKKGHLDSRHPIWYPTNQILGKGQQCWEQNNDCLFLGVERLTPTTSEFPNEFPDPLLQQGWWGNTGFNAALWFEVQCLNCALMPNTPCIREKHLFPVMGQADAGRLLLLHSGAEPHCPCMFLVFWRNCCLRQESSSRLP